MDLEKQLRACEGGKGDLVPALLWWGGVGLMSYPWALLAPFLDAQATCETPGGQRYLVYKDKAQRILNLLWLFCNLIFEQGLVLIWLRIREFWESCSRVYITSFLESTGSDLYPLSPGAPKITCFHLRLPGAHISHPRLSLKRLCL